MLIASLNRNSGHSTYSVRANSIVHTTRGIWDSDIVPQLDTMKSGRPWRQMIFLINSSANCGAVVVL